MNKTVIMMCTLFTVVRCIGPEEPDGPVDVSRFLPGVPVTAQDSLIARLMTDRSLDDEGRRLLLMGWQREARSTSLEKIDAAVRSGRIAADQGLLYRVWARFDPGRLPAEFSGDTTLRGLAGDLVLYEAGLQWNSIGADIQAQLQPFLLPPNSTGAAFQFKPSALPKRTNMISEPEDFVLKAANGLVTIHYYTELLEDEAYWTQEAINRAWPMYQTLLGIIPDDTIAVHVARLFVADNASNTITDPEGIFYTDPDGYGIICINMLDEKRTKGAAVHELFHCWQHYLDLEYSPWFNEATAVWSEDFVYKSNNTEHGFLDEIFPYFHIDMMSTVREHEYGSYLFFYYLYQRSGFAPETVGDLVKDRLVSNDVTTIAGIDNFDEEFKRYAQWNLNSGICRQYEEIKLLNKLPDGDAVFIMEALNDSVAVLNVELGKGSIKYFVIKVRDNVDVLRVRLNEFNENLDSHIGVQAMVGIGGEWTLDDWSADTLKVFFRSDAAQEVNIIVLICSSSNLEQAVSGAVTIDTRTPAWRGTITYREEAGSGATSWNTLLGIDEVLEEIPGAQGSVFIVKSQQADYKATMMLNIPCKDVIAVTCGGTYTSGENSSGITSRALAAGMDTLVRFRTFGDSVAMNTSAKLYGVNDYVTTHYYGNLNCVCEGVAITTPFDSTGTARGHSVDDLSTVKNATCSLAKDASGAMTMSGSRIIQASGGMKSVEWFYRCE